MSLATDDAPVAKPPPFRQCGPIHLDPGQASLVGATETIRLTRQQFVIAEKLMRWPGIIVEPGGLISALYPNPDDEGENPDVVLRVVVCWLRKRLEQVSEGRVTIKAAKRLGYFVEVV